MKAFSKDYIYPIGLARRIMSDKDIRLKRFYVKYFVNNSGHSEIGLTIRKNDETDYLKSQKESVTILITI